MEKSFLQSARIRIVDGDQCQRICEYLEELGYNQYIDEYIGGSDICNFIVTDISGIYVKYGSVDELYYNFVLADKSDIIECNSDEEELFFALVSLSDFSDIGQWFIWDGGDISDDDTWRKYDDNENNWVWWRFESRKATVNELIKKFGLKKRSWNSFEVFNLLSEQRHKCFEGVYGKYKELFDRYEDLRLIIKDAEMPKSFIDYIEQH